MSNLSLNRPQASRPAIREPAFLQNDHDSTDAPLAAPKPFFGRHIAFQTVIDCHHFSLGSLEEANELKNLSLFGSHHEGNLPQRIKVLEGRADAYSILAKEAEAEFLSDSGESVIQPELVADLSNTEANDASSNENQAAEIRTLLPAQLPVPFFGSGTTTDFYNSRRKQRQQLKIAAAHQEEAKKCLRESRNNMKIHALLKEHGDYQSEKSLGKIIEQLENKANYHTVMARQTEMRAYGHDPQSPGAHSVVAHGNYEFEFPLRPPSDTHRAQEIKNPREDLIRLPKTKAIPLASAQFLKSKKLSPKEKQQLPVAQKITAKEVTAESAKNVKLPEAQARRVS